MKVWVATMACLDSPNEQMTEILGVYTSRDAAMLLAREKGPRTGAVEEFDLDGSRVPSGADS